jgi:hypothetical protein
MVRMEVCTVDNTQILCKETRTCFLSIFPLNATLLPTLKVIVFGFRVLFCGALS